MCIFTHILNPFRFEVPTLQSGCSPQPEPIYQPQKQHNIQFESGKLICEADRDLFYAQKFRELWGEWGELGGGGGRGGSLTVVCSRLCVVGSNIV
jgi:hypothetical protein